MQTLLILSLCFGHVFSSNVLHLFPNGTDAMDGAFKQIYDHMKKTFDYGLYSKFARALSEDVRKADGLDAYSNYAYYPTGPHCDKGRKPGPLQGVSGMAAFPGGSVKRAYGFDFGKMAFDMTQKAEGEAGAGVAPPVTMASQGLSMGAGLIQSIVAGALHIVPPMIPPPVWNNMPLPCAPMITGHTCFGAVLYPITMSDFVIADVTDSMLDGYIIGFPNT
jgi:hypothetical protein